MQALTLLGSKHRKRPRCWHISVNLTTSKSRRFRRHGPKKERGDAALALDRKGLELSLAIRKSHKVIPRAQDSSKTWQTMPSCAQTFSLFSPVGILLSLRNIPHRSQWSSDTPHAQDLGDLRFLKEIDVEPVAWASLRLKFSSIFGALLQAQGEAT
jgi:hypothetical protein